MAATADLQSAAGGYLLGRPLLPPKISREGPAAVQWQFGYDLLPPARNYTCPHYSFCLNAHAVRDSTGFDCIGCHYWHRHERINPAEVWACIELWVELFRESIPGLYQRQSLVSKREGVWRQAEQAA